MTDDQDVIRVARFLIETRGSKAGMLARKRADDLTREGSEAAADLWRRIACAIDEFL